MLLEIYQGEPESKLGIDARNCLLLRFKNYIHTIVNRQSFIPLGWESDFAHNAFVDFLKSGAKNFDMDLGKKLKVFISGLTIKSIHENLNDILMMPPKRSTKGYIRMAIARLNIHHRITDPTPEQIRDWLLKKYGKTYSITTIKIVMDNPNIVNYNDLLEEHSVPTDEKIESANESYLGGLISTLSYDEKNLIDLHYFKGQKIKDIGIKLGLNENNACKTHLRALRKLKKLCLTAGVKHNGKTLEKSE